MTTVEAATVAALVAVVLSSLRNANVDVDRHIKLDLALVESMLETQNSLR